MGLCEQRFSSISAFLQVETEGWEDQNMGIQPDVVWERAGILATKMIRSFLVNDTQLDDIFLDAATLAPPIRSTASKS